MFTATVSRLIRRRRFRAELNFNEYRSIRDVFVAQYSYSDDTSHGSRRFRRWTASKSPSDTLFYHDGTFGEDDKTRLVLRF